MRVELHDVLANYEHVVGIHRLIGERDGQELSSLVMLLFHIHDGKIREAWEHVNATQHFPRLG
jgi:hypothetical protein